MQNDRYRATLRGVKAFPAPPDGALLSDLAERREYLANPAVAYRVPPEGIMMLGPGWSGAVDAEKLSVWADDEGRSVPLSPAAAQEISALWTQLWSAPWPQGTVSVLLHFKGALRTVGPPDDEELQAWLARAFKSDAR
jgi:hypothetical protein